MIRSLNIEKYSASALRVIKFAQDEARQLGHNFVCSEFLLLGLTRDVGSLSAHELQAAGLTYKGALSAVIKIIGHGSDKIGAEVPLTPSACQIMAHSQEEAERMGQAEIQPEHICLALLAGHPEGVAIKVLKNFGVDTKALRTRIVQQLPVRKP